MQCHFEHAHQTTSYEEGNIVFQYSRRAIQHMMNYVGFNNILHVPQGISAPPHYKNDMRVMLAGKKNQNKDYCSYELAIDKEYMESKTYMASPQPRLEESYEKFNIVSCGGKFYGIPQGEMEDFDVINVINNKRCVFGDTIHSVKVLIDKTLKVKQGILQDDDFERDKLKCKIGCEFILQSKNEDALRIFEDIKSRHNNPVTELSTEVFYHLGRIAERAGDCAVAKEYWERCLSIEPGFIKAKIKLWELQYRNRSNVCHRLFF
ncbi:MAG: hypothetical protein HQK92_00555 [Nitrospirae bacterium]|nr:hypothetical protein [Nitrospirota bacterium]